MPKLTIFRCAALALFMVHATAVQAQVKITVKLDSSFSRQVYGLPKGATDPDMALTILFYKVLQHKKQTYVCGAIKGRGPYLKTFLDQSKLKASDGKIVINDLGFFTSVSRPLNFEEVKAGKSKYPNLNWKQVEQLIFLRKNRLKILYGTPVTCRRSARKWHDSFGDGKGEIVLPKKVTIKRRG